MLALRRLAHGLLPKSAAPRRIRFGLAKGALANIDFRYDAAFFFGRHEPDLAPHYRRLLRSGFRSFDVGMYRGWDALSLSHITGAAVISFDGNPKCIEMTTEFLRPSGLPITLVCSYVSEGGDGITLDKAAAEHFDPDFIKIDVEGAEASVLRGALGLLVRKRPALIIETHGLAVEEDCISILEQINFRVLIVDRSRGPLTEARGNNHNRWLVCTPN